MLKAKPTQYVFIIPGFEESHMSPRKPGYDAVAAQFKARGVKPIHVNIRWHYAEQLRFIDYVTQFERTLQKYKPKRYYVLGFSYGATVAFLATAFGIARPAALILCSLSPYFTEDLKQFNLTWRAWFRKHFTQSDYTFKELAPKITIPTKVIVGAAESPYCIKRARGAKRLIKQSSLRLAPKARHTISDRRYLKTIESVIKSLQT